MSDPVPELEDAQPLSSELQDAKNSLFRRLANMARDDEVRALHQAKVAAVPLVRMASLAVIVTPPGQNITSLPHVQRMCDDIQRELGITAFGTYYGHQDSPEQAVDIFVTKTLGDRLAEWILANRHKYNLRYLIWWQQIWNDEIGSYWRAMSDRGSITANHKDHNHGTVYYEVPDGLSNEEEELTDQEKDDLRYVLQVSKELKDFVGSFDKDIPPGEEASFWDGQVQLRNDVRHSLIVVQELKDWFGQFDPQGENDYWRGRTEVERRLAA